MVYAGAQEMTELIIILVSSISRLDMINSSLQVQYVHWTLVQCAQLDG